MSSTAGKRTENTHARWTEQYVYYFNKKYPAEMGSDEINKFYPIW